MELEPVLLLPSIIVLVLLLGVQFLVYIRLSHRAKKSLTDKTLGKDALGPIFGDITERSRLGWPPDWAVYSDRFERITELPLERIRQCTGAALATGVGGTILLAAIALFDENIRNIFRGEDIQDIDLVVSHALIAVVASIVGIAVHLWTHVYTLGSAQKLAEDKVESLSLKVREHSQANPPRLPGEGITIEIGEVFQEVVGRLPDQLQVINRSVKSLEQVIDNQLGTMEQIFKELPGKLAELTSAADSLANTTSAMDSYSLSITESANLLKGLPGDLKTTLVEASNVWDSEIKARNDSFVSAIRDTLADQQQLLSQMEDRFKEQEAFMRDSVEEHMELLQQTVNRYGTIEALLEALPKRNGAVFVDAFKQFQEEARVHVDNLGKSVGTAVDDLIRNQSDLFNGIDTRLSKQQHTIQDILEKLSTRQEHLDQQYAELNDLVNQLPEKNRESIQPLVDAFIAEARGYVLGLEVTLEDGLKKLMEELKRDRITAYEEFVARTAESMEALLGHLRLQIEEAVTQPLATMCVSLERAANVLPKAADNFSRDLEAVSETLRRLPQQLNTIVQEVDELTQTTKEIQHQLTKAFSEAATEALKPAGDKAELLIEKTEKDHQLIRDNANDLIRLISGIIKMRNGS